MKYTKYVGVYAVFLLMFFLGRYAARFAKEYTTTMTVAMQAENWGLGFDGVAEGGQPTGNATPEELKQYDAYFVGNPDKKVLYLTFDCGYENGNTGAILDALKKHNVPATFFVVGHYVESAPDMVKRMIEEGHTVGNHTYHHPDMSAISSLSAFQKEMDDVADAYKELTGQDMSMYYRPPQGKYSTNNLNMAKQLGYSTFFWSLAYVDWNVDKQPSHEDALKKLTERVHPGAVVLLHNTSKTNGEILDELLTKWEEMGYTFGTLEELKSAYK
ncbi:MAG: polysaccharide deacetylase family protein [Lachnospiraceae bacterium]|nr:polysaccharide deacetylase family protein [Lachnospiraceae bacterium]